jgi:hypothetical protein
VGVAVGAAVGVAVATCVGEATGDAVAGTVDGAEFEEPLQPANTKQEHMKIHRVRIVELSGNGTSDVPTR